MSEYTPNEQNNNDVSTSGNIDSNTGSGTNGNYGTGGTYGAGGYGSHSGNTGSGSGYTGASYSGYGTGGSPNQAGGRSGYQGGYNYNGYSGYSYNSTQNNGFGGQTPNGGFTPPHEPKKKKRSRIVALCLACVILAGAAGTGVGVLISSMNKASVVQSGDNNSESGYSASIQTPYSNSGTDSDSSSSGNGSDSNSNSSSNSSVDGKLNVNIADDSNASATTVKAQYTGETLSASEIYALAVQSCVGIKTDVTETNVFGQVTSGAISGSGFIISSDGYILTNYHVIETADEQGLDIKVTLYSGDEYTAKIVGKEADNDIALLKIEATGLNAVVLNTSGNLLVGQTVYAIGNPLGELTYTMTSGLVSAVDRDITVESNLSINMFQIDAAINSGNSGGPVLNDKGEVIGIVSAKYSSTGVEGLGFAIPIKDAMDIVGDLMQYGYVRGKPYFGISVKTVTSSVAQYYNMVEGAYVDAVDANSCAATAGLQVGDIITKLDDTDITSSSDLVLAKKNYKAGDTANLTVYRSGQYLQMVITFDEEGTQTQG